MAELIIPPCLWLSKTVEPFAANNPLARLVTKSVRFTYVLINFWRVGENQINLFRCQHINILFIQIKFIKSRSYNQEE